MDISLFTTVSGQFVKKSVVYAQASAPAGTVADTFQDGTSATARVFADGEFWMETSAGVITLKRWDSIQSEWDDVATDDSVATGGFVMKAATAQPTGTPLNGTTWFDAAVDGLAILRSSS